MDLSDTPDIAGPLSQDTREMEFERELTTLLNRYSKENGSNTPDFILSKYLIGCLDNFNKTSKAREHWYGKSLSVVQQQLEIE